MKNLKFLFVILVSVLMVDVYAISSNAIVESRMTEYSCSAFQDDNMHISGDTYFGRCMEARCDGNNWNLKYYSTNSVSCSNGNLNPYVKIAEGKDGCSSYRGNKSCSGNELYYCTTITYFDCNRTSNGAKYTTTTKKTTVKTKPTTTTTTETTTTAKVLDNNTYLSEIILSNGAIQFNKEVKEYSISVDSNISSINIQATPEVETSTVTVQGNNNLIGGMNKVSIIVTAEDGSVGTYIIHVEKEEKLSNNARLSSLIVQGYDLNFSSDIYNYTLKTKENSLAIEAVTEDENAIYMVEGNTNLKNGSVIKVVVTAEDGITMQEYSIMIQSSGGSAIVTILFVIILIVVIGGGAFYFYNRSKNGGEKEYEYE